MSRSSPTVLVEMVDSNTYKVDQIIESAGIWVVFYNDQPFNLRTTHYLSNDIPPKYRKTAFSNPGHARNLCRKLNAKFKTDKFNVVFMNTGNKVYP